MGLKHGGHQTLDAATAVRRQGHERRALQLGQLVLSHLGQLGQSGLGVFLEVPFGGDIDERPAFTLDQIGQLQVLGVEGVVLVHDQNDHLGEGDGADGVGDRQLLQLLLHPGLATHAGGVDQPDVLAFVFPVDRDGVAGDAGLGAGQHAVLADQAVDQGRLARVGAADNGNTDWLVGFVDLFDEDVGRCGDHGRVQVGHTLAVLGRDGDRLSEAQRIGLADAAAALAALGLVGQQDDGLVLFAQAFGENLVQRCHALPGVHHEQDQVAVLQRRLGLFAHPGFEAVVGDVLIARGVDQGQVHVADVAIRVPAVAGHTRPIVDQRETLADETIEECRLAHIRAADDGDFESHVGLLTQIEVQRQRMLTRSPLSVRT